MPQPMGADLIGAGRYERVLIGRLGCYPIGGEVTHHFTQCKTGADAGEGYWSLKM